MHFRKRHVTSDLHQDEVVLHLETAPSTRNLWEIHIQATR
jgi:hypothetical protein